VVLGPTLTAFFEIAAPQRHNT